MRERERGGGGEKERERGGGGEKESLEREEREMMA